MASSCRSRPTTGRAAGSGSGANASRPAPETQSQARCYPRSMTDTATILRTVEAGGHRVTGSRRAVADLIAGRTDHFTAADLVEDARTRRLDLGRATIFRSLELFLELGVVERLDLPDGQHAYVECGRAHHHHVVCSVCGRATDVEDCVLDAVAREVER